MDWIAWPQSDGGGPTRFGRPLTAALIGVGLILVIRYAIQVQPLTESVDYYSNVLYARDLANGVHGVSLDRYAYFPGLYAFWRLALWISGGSLDAVRWVYIALLGINASLVGLVIFRVSKATGPAFVGGFWYVLTCAIFDGFQGLTEPIATAPVLAGLLVWGGLPLSGREGWWRTVALGSGLGLGLYGKQQGGLLALGAAALLVHNIAGDRASAHEYRQLVALPIIALAVFVTAVWGDGYGLEPVRIALDLLPRVWRERGSPFVANIAFVAYRNWLLWLGWLAAAVVWLSALVRTRRAVAPPWSQVMGFCVIAMLASLEQFELQGYLHYFLIGAPTAIIAAVLAGMAITTRVRRAWPRSRWVEAVTASFAVFPLLAGHTGYSSPFAWRSPPPHHLWRNDPQYSRDLYSIASALEPGEDVLVLPPRRNEIHALAGTVSLSYSHGYGWIPAPGIIARAIDSPNLRAVVVVRFLDSTDSLFWRRFECDAAVQSLGRHGFHLVRDLSTMSLWRR